MEMADLSIYLGVCASKNVCAWNLHRGILEASSPGGGLIGMKIFHFWITISKIFLCPRFWTATRNHSFNGEASSSYHTISVISIQMWPASQVSCALHTCWHFSSPSHPYLGIVACVVRDLGHSSNDRIGQLVESSSELTVNVDRTGTSSSKFINYQSYSITALHRTWVNRLSLRTGRQRTMPGVQSLIPSPVLIQPSIWVKG